MLCTHCKSNQADFHYKSNVNGTVYEAHLCKNCAQKYGYTGNETLLGSVFDAFSDNGFFGSVLDGVSGEQVRESLSDKSLCPGCSMSYYQLKQGGKAGCEKCYKTFRNVLLPSVQKIHGNVCHVGKIPHNFNRQSVKNKEISDIKEQLKVCIENQEYEKAALLRDRIKELESDGGNVN